MGQRLPQHTAVPVKPERTWLCTGDGPISGAVERPHEEGPATTAGVWGHNLQVQRNITYSSKLAPSTKTTPRFPVLADTDSLIITMLQSKGTLLLGTGNREHNNSMCTSQALQTERHS